ncbi:TPA: hypothetical protein ROY17_004800 [Bacillus thuringiensis]|nr:hypothetical protein [Bacillus thuringiensis]
MKKQVKILLTAGIIVSPAFVASIVPLPGIQTEGIHVYAAVTETFEKAETDIIDKSKDVIKKETEAWKKDLKSDVKTVIDNISKESDLKTITKINTELRQGDETKSKDTIEKLDAALRTAPVTKEATKVYIDVSLKNDFDVSKDNVKTGETVITENGYIKGSLARNTSASTSEVIELTIPKGEHMANMTASGSTTISYNELLERGRSFVITAKKEIKDMGKTRTKIEAILLPKNAENTKIQEFTTEAEAETYLNSKLLPPPLTEAEINLLSNLDKLVDLNEKLEKYRNASSNLISSSVKNNIKEMDNVFSKATKTETPIVVYIPLTESELGYKKGNFDSYTKNADGQVEKLTKIAEDSFKELEGNFQYGSMNTFRAAQLVKPTDITEPIVLKLTIPKNTPLLPGYASKVVLPRDKGLNISNAKIIKNPNDNGREEYIQVEGIIVSKDEITSKIKVAEASVNKKFQEIIGDNRAKLVSFEMDGLYASSVEAKAEALLKKLTQTVPSKVMLNVLDKMNQDSAFIFTDKSLTNYHNYANTTTAGFYYPVEKQLYIQPNHPAELSFKEMESSLIGKTPESEETLRHEFMHAVDALLLDGTIISGTLAFRSLYDTYRGKFENTLASIIQKETGNSLNNEQIQNQMQYKILKLGELTNFEKIDLQTKIEQATNTKLEDADKLDINLYVEKIMYGGITTENLAKAKSKIEQVTNNKLTDVEAEPIFQVIKNTYLPADQMSKIKESIKVSFSEGTYRYTNEKEFWAVLGEKYFSSNPNDKQELTDKYLDVSDFMDKIFKPILSS